MFLLPRGKLKQKTHKKTKMWEFSCSSYVQRVHKFP